MMSLIDQLSPVHIGILFVVLLAIFVGIRSFSLPKTFSDNQKIREQMRLKRSMYQRDILEEDESEK